MKKIKLFSLFAAMLFAGSAMAAAYTPNAAIDTILLSRPNINANDYLSVSADKWATGKDYGKSLGFTDTTSYFNMSTGRILSIDLCDVDSFSVYVYYSNSKGETRSYSVQVGTAKSDTITHNGSGLVGTTAIATNTTGEVTIKLAGTGNSVYPVAVRLHKHIPTSPTLTSFTINGVEAVIDDEAKTITALLPNGTTINWESVAVVLGGTATKWSISDDYTTLTISNEDASQEVTYALSITVAECAFTELALSGDSIGAIIETEDLVEPTLANPHNLSVVYASSNEEVVTVDQTGALTKVGVGEATITIPLRSRP